MKKFKITVRQKNKNENLFSKMIKASSMGEALLLSLEGFESENKSMLLISVKPL